MIIHDKIWGDFEIEKKYAKLLESKEIQTLKRKKQLGLHPSDNATHTRYEHSLGVHYLACRLVDIIKEKFSDVIEMTKEDEEAIKIFGLVHDIGHGPFSHFAECFLEGSHEDNTVRLLEGNTEIRSLILQYFSKEVLDKVIALVSLKERVKKEENVSDKPDLTFIIAKLLSGGIDIDRLDYIARDSYHVLGEKFDFSKLLDYIGLNYINDYLAITFDKDAEYLIANYLNKRFELYDLIYSVTAKIIIENYLLKFLKKENYPVNWLSDENAILKDLEENLDHYDEVSRRCIDIALSRKLDEDIKYMVFDSELQFDYFMKSLFQKLPIIISYKNAIVVGSQSVSIYGKKNKIYIDDNGTIFDMNECQILNSNLEKKKYVVALDFKLLKFMLEKDNIENVSKILKILQSLFKNNIEQEKKYVLSDPSYLEEIEKILYSEGQKQSINEDDYYLDMDGVLEKNRITVRERKRDNASEWNVKIPFADKSSITKRIEMPFSSINEACAYLEQVLGKEFILHNAIKLITRRTSYLLKFRNSLFEIALDKTRYDDNTEEHFMIECELKEGNPVDMYFLNKKMLSIPGLVSCNKAKIEIALEDKRKGKQKKREIQVGS